MEELRLVTVHKFHPLLKKFMGEHYSKPLSFVGRSICYLVCIDKWCYGGICGGSATKYLPGRNAYFGWSDRQLPLDKIANNIFFHIHPNSQTGRYPIRNFSQMVIKLYEKQIEEDWYTKYQDVLIGHETLVELPRLGTCYKRSGWKEVGVTKGYTCKRIAGWGTDSWTGKRIWDTKNLRPKRVFCKTITI